MRNWTWLVTWVVVLAAMPAAAKETYPAIKADSPITLDGRLDEPAWNAAEKSSDFVWLASREKSRPVPATWFKVVHDDDAVYIGIYCGEPRMDKLVVNQSSVMGNDSVEIFVDPLGKGVTYYQFAIAANNSRWDGNYIEGGNTGGPAGHPAWNSAVHLDKDCWSVEVRLPLTAFMYTRATTFEPVWLLNVSRGRNTEGWDHYTWSHLISRFHEPKSFNLLSNMPRKDPTLDAGVTEVKAAVASGAKGKYTGDLKVKIDVAPETAGPCAVQALCHDKPIASPVNVTLKSGVNEVTIPNFELSGLGRTDIQLKLTHAGGKTITDMTYLTLVEYEPMRFVLDEPFYRRNFYPDEKIEHVRGTVRVNLPEQELAGSQVELTLAGPAMTTSLSQKVPVKHQQADFTFDAAGMIVGKAELTCRVLSAKGEPLLDGATTIQRLDAAPGSSIRIDRNLNFVENGKPIFVRHWCGPDYMVSRELAEKYPDGPVNVSFWRGVGASLEAERIDPTDRQNAAKDVRPSDKVMEETRRRVLEARSDPKLRYYYLADEPECRGISPVYLRYQYELARELDPYHPVMIISRSPEYYVHCADILNPHPYIGPMIDGSGKRTIQNPKMIGRMIRDIHTAGEGKIAAWQTPQAFSYEFVNRFAVPPTFAEYRMSIYAGLVAGMKGLTPFLYGAQFSYYSTRLGSPFIYESLAMLDPWVLSPVPPSEVKVAAPDDGVEAWAKTVDGKTLLVAVNLLDKPVSATIESPALEGVTKLYGFREAGTTAVSSNTITIDLPRYGVHILTNPPMGEKLQTVAELEAEIAAKEKEDASRGNLLYKHNGDMELTSSSTYMYAEGVAVALFNGIRDDLAWRRITGIRENPWVQISFTGISPKFKTMKVYGASLAGLQLQTWENQQWHTLAEAPKELKGYETEFKFEQPVEPVKIRLMFTQPDKGGAEELYELEMYE
ncbi:MAG: hypothetical protein IT440_02045 [Phycisphaeraceae bacterium]|nr:hypothetical protein [Phycisphaeraceae bacterium]